MKKTALLFSVLALLLTGCSKDKIYDGEPEIITHVLEFESMASFEQAVSDMFKEEVGLSTRSVVEEKTGDTTFLSLYDIYLEAIEVIDGATTEGMMRQAKNFYGQYLLFNEIDPEDNSPYLPVSNSTYARLMGPDGTVRIAGESIDMRDISSYEDTFYYMMEQEAMNGETRKFDADKAEVVSTSNSLYVFNGRGNKMWCQAFANSGVVYVEVSAQRKKALIGWNTYKDDYYFFQRTNPGGGPWTPATQNTFTTNYLKTIEYPNVSAHTKIPIGYYDVTSTGPLTIDFGVYTGEIERVGMQTLLIRL